MIKIFKFELFLTLTISIIFLLIWTSTGLADDKDIPSLYQEYEKHFPVGAAVAVADRNRTLDSHRDLIKKHFNSVTAENVMKPETTQPARGKFDFSQADELVDFAENNNMKVRGHTLVWYNQTPDWFFEDENGNRIDKKDQISKKERQLVIDRMEDHISRVVGEYRGRVYAWDVVNEAIDQGTFRQSPWLEIIGEEYIEKAFKFAHKEDPEAKLFYNDYNTVQRREEIYEMVKELIENDVPIHGIGMQGHWGLDEPSITEIEKTIQKFAELDDLTDKYDFEIQITELDITMFSWGDESKPDEPSEEMLKKQARRYEDLFELFIEYSDIISGVTFWGVADDATWLDNFPVENRNDWPLLFDENHEPKDAFWKVIDLMK